MTEEDQVQRSIADHVRWCREKCESLEKELALYRNGTMSVGERKIGESATLGTITHVQYLCRTIEQLKQVIRAYSPPQDSADKR